MTETIVDIRPASFGDARLLWTWRNDPQVRAASLNNEPIPFESHQRWFEASLADPLREILVAEQKGRPIGMVRFDVDADIASINIILDPKDRGRGLAKQILARAISNSSLSFSQLRATVKAENAASIGLFRSLGFIIVKTGDVYEFKRARDEAT